MKKYIASILVGAALTLACTASATLITFDDGQPNNSAIGGFYSGLGVTFTDAMWTDNFGLAGTSGTQAVASISSIFQPQQANPIGASFSTLVSSVTLRGIDVGEQGFRLKAFDASNTLVDNQVVLGTGAGVGAFFDLTVNGSIARIEFSQDNPGTGGDGMIFENLAFTPVPEPASMAALGLGAVALLRRRRQK